MVNLSFEELVVAAQKLPEAQKVALIRSLQTSARKKLPTREDAVVELEALRAAGAFTNLPGLRDRFANPALADLTDEELLASIHEAASEWEKEIDEFFPGDN